MARTDIIYPLQSSGKLPVVRTISPADLKEILAKGFDDFKAMPTHVVFLCVIYPLVGIFMYRIIFGYNVFHLLYPLATGFALVGPIAGVGLYELSRRREMRLDTSWKHAFDVFYSPSLPQIMILASLLLLIFVIWIAAANSIYVTNFGYAEPESLVTFSWQVLTTPHGHNLIIAGNIVGFLFALLVLTISVVSFPLLLDRNVGYAGAISTSARAVLKNPTTMLLWGLIVAIGLLIGSLSLFVGLAIVLPVLGHSTWHLYRKVVEPGEGERLQFPHSDDGVHVPEHQEASRDHEVDATNRNFVMEQTRDSTFAALKARNVRSHIVLIVWIFNLIGSAIVASLAYKNGSDIVAIVFAASTLYSVRGILLTMSRIIEIDNELKDSEAI